MLLVGGFVVCNRKWGLQGFGSVSLGGFGRLSTQFGDERKMNIHRIFFGLRALALLAVVAGGLLALAACNPQALKPPPLPVSPSVVFTQDGVAFYVKGLRIPGTRQELRLREGGTLTWVPLEQVSAVRFSGPVRDTYRQAVITLTGGERLQGEVYVNFLIEGTTDLGYWNMPMSKVASLNLAFD
jgi:hypothetical protein